MEQKPPLEAKRTFLLILICIGVWWAWQQYLQKKYPEAMGLKSAPQGQTTAANPTPAVEAQTAQKDSKGATETLKPLTPSQIPQNLGPEKTWVYEDSVWKATVSSHGGRISEVRLKKYTDSKNEPVAILSPNLPGFLLTDVVVNGNILKLSQLNYSINQKATDTVELSGQISGLNIRKTLQFVPEKYIVKTKLYIDGAGAPGVQSVNLDIGALIPQDPDSGSSTLSFLGVPSPDVQEYFFKHGSKESREMTDPKEGLNQEYEQTHLASLGSRYFSALLFNRTNIIPTGQALREGNVSVLRLKYPVLEKRDHLNIDIDLYAGPKALQQLAQVDESAKSVIDYGIFSWIAIPLLELMKWFYGIFKNWGVAIIALTILVRILTYPFTYVSYKSMKSMQKIQPEIARLKEIYKNDTPRLNQEMIKLMRDNKVNPMGGCLPLLLQLPVFWALYQVLQNAIELYHSPFIFWIHDLSDKDPYYVLPVLMGISMFIQQKITPNTMDPAQARIMLIMPVFFSFLMFGLPSGLTLYIFVSTVFGIIQQLVMMRDNAPAGQAVVRRA